MKHCIQPRRLRIKDSGLILLLSEKDLEMVKLIRYTGLKHDIKLQIASQRVEPPQWLFSIPYERAKFHIVNISGVAVFLTAETKLVTTVGFKKRKRTKYFSQCLGLFKLKEKIN